jgi:hypothetical protein
MVWWINSKRGGTGKGKSRRGQERQLPGGRGLKAGGTALSFRGGGGLLIRTESKGSSRFGSLIGRKRHTAMQGGSNAVHRSHQWLWRAGAVLWKLRHQQ